MLIPLVDKLNHADVCVAVQPMPAYFLQYKSQPGRPVLTTDYRDYTGEVYPPVTPVKSRVSSLENYYEEHEEFQQTSGVWQVKELVARLENSSDDEAPVYTSVRSPSLINSSSEDS